MNFFQTGCQEGPFNQKEFGICDDQNLTKAYVDLENREKWVATVKNPEQRPLTFTAIDKCVILDDEEAGRKRCDGMLTTSGLLYLVELKDKKSDWQTDAIAQLESTIQLLRATHDLSAYTLKKAFACNKRHRVFAEIDNEQNLLFFRKYGFRLDIQATVLVV